MGGRQQSQNKEPCVGDGSEEDGVQPEWEVWIGLVQAEELLRRMGVGGKVSRGPVDAVEEWWNRPGVVRWVQQSHEWFQKVPSGRRDGPPPVVGKTRNALKQRLAGSGVVGLAGGTAIWMGFPTGPPRESAKVLLLGTYHLSQSCGLHFA
jgi:hypothetical protein